MTISVARDRCSSWGDDDSVPLSLVRVRSRPPRRLNVEPRTDAFRSTLVDPTVLSLQKRADLPEDLDERLESGFARAVAQTRAHVGLLHRRGEAFLYTTCVHGLDTGMHMLVWVSMWDAAVQVMLRGLTLAGASELSAEHAIVARRLGATNLPTSILAVPVMVGSSVEAMLELGRFGRGFSMGAELNALAAMQGALARHAAA